jgi:spore coat assembly protein SafA
VSHKKEPPKELPLVEKRLLKVDKAIGETLVKKAVDTTVTLPIAAARIFDIAASVTNIRGEVREGGVLVTGTIKKQLYIADEGDLVRHVPEEIPFREFVPVEGARPRLNAHVRASVIDVDTTLIDNGNKVQQEVLLEIFVKVTEIQQIEVVTDVKGGPKDLMVETRLLKVHSVVGEDSVSEVVQKTAELPITAKQIFQVIAEVRDVETEAQGDRVVVKGIVHKQIFLMDEGDLVRHVSEDVPFSVVVTIPGARPGFDVQADVAAIVDRFELLDPPGQKLRQTIVLDIFVKAAEILQLDAVSDVKGEGIEAFKKLLIVDEVGVDVFETATVAAEVELPMEAEKIFRIMAEITNVETEIVNGRVIVRAVLQQQLFFVDKDGFLRHMREDVPFQVVANAPGAEPGMKVQARLRLNGDIDFDLVNGKLVQQKAVIDAFLKVTRTVQLEVAVDVISIDALVPPKRHIPSKDRFVIVKKGDTLWKIAQREGVTLDALIAANPQINDPNLVFPGQKVFIPSKPHPHPKPKPPTTRVYIVQQGDTLFKIVQRFDVLLDDVIRANPQIKDPNLIFPGQKILIPHR